MALYLYFFILFEVRLTLTAERRELLRIVTSNRRVDQKNVVFTLTPPFDRIATRFTNANGALGENRTPILSLGRICSIH